MKNLWVYAGHKTYKIIYSYSDFFEGRDIKSIQELSKTLIEMCQATELSMAYSLQNIDVISFVKFRHHISEHRYTERKLARSLSFERSFQNGGKLQL